MKKTTLITIMLSLLAVPAFSFAEANPDNNGHAIEAQIFTTCSQEAIEARDSSISSARTAYNTTMAVALNARKEAEKKAVGLSDSDEKKSAIKNAVEEYKKAVNHAQETLIKARKEAWATFERDTENCREASKERKDSATTTPHAAAMKENDDRKQEPSLKETLKAKIESIKNLLKIGE